MTAHSPRAQAIVSRRVHLARLSAEVKADLMDAISEHGPDSPEAALVRSAMHAVRAELRTATTSTRDF